MASSLEEEIKKRQAAAALLTDDSDTSDASDSSDSDSPDKTATAGDDEEPEKPTEPDKPVAEPERKATSSYVLTPVDTSPEAPAAAARPYHTELAPPGEMDLRPDDAAPRAESVPPQDVTVPRAPLVSIGPKAVPADTSKDIPLPAVTVEDQAQGETPKFSSYSPTTQQWNLTMPDGSVRHVPLEGYSGSGPIGGPAAPTSPVAPAQPATPRAQPAAKSDTGFYPDEKPEDFISGRASMFADQGDIDRYNAAKARGLSDNEAFQIGDNGIGSKYLGGLQTTNLYGIAIPEDALRYQLGNNYAAWRKARVDVVDPQSGKRLRLPIVDVGPGAGPQSKGVIADFTPGVDQYFGNDGGGKNLMFRLVKDAGPDVNKDPGSFADEQAALSQGFDARSVEKANQRLAPSYTLTPVAPSEQVAADQATQYDVGSQRDSLGAIAAQTPNLGALIKTLDKPVPGVSEGMRQDYLANVKDEATRYAQDYYGIKDPKEAYAKITSDAGAGDVAGEVLSKIIPNFGKADVSIARFMDSADEKRVRQFIDALHPEATQEAKGQEIKRLVDTPQEMRGPVINQMIAHTDPTTAQAIGDPGNILDSLNRFADPKYQAQRAAAIGEKQAWVNRSLRTDPRLVGTPAEFVTSQLAALPKNVFESMLPPGFRETAFYSEIYSDAADQLRRENPHLSEDEIDRQANASAIAQLVPQEVLMHAIGGKLGAISAGIQNPVKRIATSALIHTGIGTAAGAGQQVAANVVAGKPVMEGVPAAAAGGAIQSLPGGIVAGFHKAPVMGEQAPEAQPTTGQEGAPIHGAETKTLEEGAQTDQTGTQAKPPPFDEAAPTEKEQALPPEADEEALNKQAADLYKQHQAEIELTKEKPIVSDTIKDEERKSVEQEGAGQLQQPVQEDVSRGDVPVDTRGGGERGSQPVPPELGRVSGALDTKLSPEQSAAFEPERQALANAQFGTPEHLEAYRAMRDKVIQRFQPLMDALGVRWDPQNEVGSHGFAAGRDPDGGYRLNTNLESGAVVADSVMHHGGDPVERLHSTMQEELIHFAQMDALKDQWLAKGGEKGTGSDRAGYETKTNAELIKEALKARDAYRAKGDTAHADLIEHTLADSMVLYNQGKYSHRQQALSALEAWVKKPSVANHENLSLAAYEAVRQLVQTGAKENLTESHTKGFWKKAGEYYQQALDGLKNLYRKLGPRSEFGKLELAKMIRAVQAKLKTIDSIVANDKLNSYRGETDEDLASAHAMGDHNARQILRERYPDKLPEHLQDIVNPKRRAAREALERQAEEQARAQHQAEVEQEGREPAGHDDLLSALQQAGGLPHPLVMARMAKAGETHTGEWRMVHDAWKALSLDTKRELAKRGITYNKLFNRKAKSLDVTRGDLAQHPDGFNYGTSAELLAQAEHALTQAARGRKVYGENYSPEAPGAPRKVKKHIADQFDLPLGKDEPFRLVGEKLPEPEEKKPEPLPDTTGELFPMSSRGPDEGGGGPRVTARPARQKETFGEKLRSGVRWYGQVFKGGESAMLDNPETQPLALAMRRRPSLEQKFGQRAQITQLADAFHSIPRNDRPRVVKEFSDYTRAEQMKKPLPAVGADTQRLIDAGKNSLEQLGQIAKDLNLHVRTSDGKIRPLRLIGRDYYPRMISEDMRNIFNERDGAHAAEFNQIVNDQIAKGKVKSREEFIDKFAQATTPDRTSNGHFNNLEKAREANLPLDFYDFSPEALLKYAERANKRLAQVGAYGQKLSAQGKDLFDHTIEAVEKNSSLPYRDKQAVITRIQQERRAEYAEHEQTNLGKISSLTRSAASGAFLGNPITSMYNLISGAAQNLAFGGPGAFAKTFGKFLTIKGAIDNIKEARERNILRSNLSEILHDYELTTDQGWATKGVQGFTKNMLHWGGQNITEGINRAFAMQQGKYILNQFARIFGQDNARARSIYEMIKRRGIYDLSGLAKEKGNGPLTDEFLRQYTMDVHGNYGPSQSAAHLFDSPAGKVLTQFQKWGANTQRIATREFLMPLARAARERKPADFAYQLSRNIGYLATAVGAGGAAQMLRNLLVGKDPQDPTVQEIWKRFGQGNGARAMEEALQRAWGAIILSGFTGTIGNYSDLANQLTGATPGARVKDPLHPPAWGIVQPFINFIQGWNGENHFTAAPSPRVWDDLMQNLLSAYRVSKPMVLNAMNASGLKMPLGQEYAAKNDLSFLRSRVKQFEDENPEFRAKRQIQGNRDISMSGRGEFDPIKDRIQGALLTGHAEEAQRAFADWLDRFAPGEQKGRLNGIKQSIQSSSPIKPGGSYSLDSELQFLRWAKENLPEDEARKIFASAQTYARTATETGLFDRNKTMQAISKLDYDKFAVTTPEATAKVTVVRPGQPTIAQQIRKAIAAKQLMAH